MLVFKQLYIFLKRVVPLRRLIFLHWQSFLAKMHLIMCSDSAPRTHPVHLGQCNTNIYINIYININDPVCVISPKANRGQNRVQNQGCLCQKTFPLQILFKCYSLPVDASFTVA